MQESSRLPLIGDDENQASSRTSFTAPYLRRLLFSNGNTSNFRKVLLATICWWPVVLMIVGVLGFGLYVLFPETVFHTVPSGPPPPYATFGGLSEQALPSSCVGNNPHTYDFNQWKLDFAFGKFANSLFFGSFPFDTRNGAFRFDELNHLLHTYGYGKDCNILLINTITNETKSETCLKDLAIAAGRLNKIAHSEITTMNNSFSFPMNPNDTLLKDPYDLNEKERLEYAKNFTSFTQGDIIAKNLNFLASWNFNESLKLTPTVVYLFDSTGLSYPAFYSAAYSLTYVDKAQLADLWATFSYKYYDANSYFQNILQWLCLAIENAGITSNDADITINSSPGCLDLNRKRKAMKNAIY